MYKKNFVSLYSPKIMHTDMFFNLYSHVKRIWPGMSLFVFTLKISNPKTFLKLVQANLYNINFYHYRVRQTEITELSIMKYIYFTKVNVSVCPDC